MRRTLYDVEQDKRTHERAFRALPDKRSEPADREKIHAIIRKAALVPQERAADFRDGYHYFVRLRYRGRETKEVLYSMGAAHKAPPDAASILCSLVSDANGTDQSFEDWADDSGYDSDSRKAEGTYKACLAIRYDLRKVLGTLLGTLMAEPDLEIACVEYAGKTVRE